MVADLKIPQRFCWTKFGTESGEPIEQILSRKEQERQANNGLFLWGIGNSVAPGIRELVRLEETPLVIFSPMRSKAKTIDVSPSSIVIWSRAQGIDDREWCLPEGSTVTSRAGAGSGDVKQSHYALVCSSSTPLTLQNTGKTLQFEELTNLLSGAPLGHSQVTAVVQHTPHSISKGTPYSVGFVAQLVYPYFVKLFDALPAGSRSSRPHAIQQHELSYQ